MMACLLAEIRTNGEEMKTNQAKTGVNLKKIRADKEEMLTKTEINEGRLVAKIEQMPVWIGNRIN
jgi:cell fate (sporulation/competence/biofilm development) regulator YmcA (YheA/YmcA/DUF963 family)